jgi:hypothetical protein
MMHPTLLQVDSNTSFAGTTSFHLTEQLSQRKLMPLL